MEPIRILLQTTIEPDPDDWEIGRFSLLAAFLSECVDEHGEPLATVVSRDRAAPPGATDPVLGRLDESDFDEMWLFAVDTGAGLNADECAAIGRFRARGGGLMVTRDHMDLGSSVCTLGGVGRAHHFHSRNPNPDPVRQHRDDTDTMQIDWPNYHSGANGDFQLITPEGPTHPLLGDPALKSKTVRRLPAHPHEGDISAPPDDPTARVIATGRSRTTGACFNIAVAFEQGPEGEGRALAQSTFHHFCDYNWDPRKGCPSFVSETPGYGMITHPDALRQTKVYMRNLAVWLGGRPLPSL